MNTATKYDYTVTGGYADTMATMADGRRVIVNTQHSRVDPLGQHAANCAQVTRMGGRCDCGLLDGIDCQALVADATKRGKFGRPPQSPETQRAKAQRERALDDYDTAAAKINAAMIAGEDIRR